MNKQLPARPNLDHLRRQAKSLLAQLKAGDPAAHDAFVEHLPAARTPGATSASFRLADAQSVVARQTGHASWPALARHVEQLRSLEGEWRFASLEIDGAATPGEMLAQTRILMDGDRFRVESPEGTYEGVFTIDVEASPAHIDIEFVAGPDAGSWSRGIYELDGDALTMCLGLVGSTRPERFATRPGGGHALERLRRTSVARPENVTGGTPPEPWRTVAEREDPSTFDVAPSSLLSPLQGDWAPVELVIDGKRMPDNWLAFGTRTLTGSEVKVVFGGQTMLHARIRIDDRVQPIAIDYLDLRPATAGVVSRGIMEWVGDDVRFVIVPPGKPRPTTFDPPRAGTLSRWRRR